MSFNQGYQDGLGGMKRPSNGDWGSFNAGSSARQEQAFYTGLQNQANAWSNAKPNAWSSWSPASPPPLARPWTAEDAAAADAFWSGAKHVLLFAWALALFAILIVLVGAFSWLPRAIVLMCATIGRLPGGRGLALVRVVLDPIYNALALVEDFFARIAYALFDPKHIAES